MLQSYQNSNNVQTDVIIDKWWTTMRPNQSTIQQNLAEQNIKPAYFNETAPIKIVMVND